MESRGALLLRTHDEVHLADDIFGLREDARLLNQAVEDALNDGFAGLRTCGDMPGCLLTQRA
jgi:hypothetical protein